MPSAADRVVALLVSITAVIVGLVVGTAKRATVLTTRVAQRNKVVGCSTLVRLKRPAKVKFLVQPEQDNSTVGMPLSRLTPSERVQLSFANDNRPTALWVVRNEVAGPTVACRVATCTAPYTPTRPSRTKRSLRTAGQRVPIAVAALGVDISYTQPVAILLGQ